jgi:hypothetical protein
MSAHNGSDESMLPTLIVGSADLAHLFRLQPEALRRWPASFSCNRRSEVWVPSAYGYTPHEQRQLLTRVSSTLDQIVAFIRARRWRGGRFFICEHGVWTYDEDRLEQVQVLAFQLRGAMDAATTCTAHYRPLSCAWMAQDSIAFH